MPWSRGHEEIIFDALDRYDEALLGQRRGSVVPGNELVMAIVTLW
jgi:hypothetical protein